MKCLCFIVSFITLINCNCLAQINTTLPSWVNKIDIKSASTVNKKQIKDGYYYVLFDEQYNTLKNENFYHYATSAISEEALVSISQIELNYDPSFEKIILHSVFIHRNNQIIDKIKDIELKILNEENQRNIGILNGKKTLFANLSDVRKGDILEYSYSIIGKNPILKNYFNYSFLLSYSVPLGKIYIRVLFDKTISPTLVYLNTKQKPIILTTDCSDYVWEINNPPTTELESTSPNWYNPFATIQISNLKNWGEVKQHCQNLFKLPSYNKTSLQTIIDSIKKDAISQDEQITAIVDFVQTQIRYSGNENGIYSHVPRTPDFVIKNRYGDCKEKSVLLSELLNLINIKGYPVLLNTLLGKTVEQQAPSINAFDHCISVFIVNDKKYFIDPTISYQRGDFKLRILPDYEKGMILDGSSLPFDIIATDKSSKCEILEEFIIDDEGNATLKATSKYTGILADELRYFTLINSLNDIQKSYKEFYQKYTDEIDVIDSVKFNDDETLNEITCIEFYKLKKFWVTDDSLKSITKDFIPYFLNSKLIYGEENKRKDPLKINYPCNYTQTITVSKSGGFNLSDDLKTNDNNYFYYNFSTNVKNDILYLNYTYHSKIGVIEPKDYLDYKEKMDFINLNMVFSVEEKPTNNSVYTFNWILIAVIVVAFIVSSIAIPYFYNKPFITPYQNKYNSISGWLGLLGVGIFINPFVLLFSLYKQYADDFNINYLELYFNPISSSFSPMQGYFSLFVLFFNIILFAFSILIIVVFFQRKNTFRLYFVCFRIFNVVLLIIDVIVLYSLYHGSSIQSEREIIVTETNSMFSVIIQACIWVPYVWFSEKSKHTFTVGNPIKEVEVDSKIQ